MNPLNYFEKKFKQNKNQTAIIWKSSTFTYETLLKKIHEIESHLDSLSIKSGTVIMIDGDFSPVCISYIFALIKKRCIIIPIYYLTKSAKQDKIQISKPEFLLTINDETAVFENLEKHTKSHDLYEILLKKNHPGLILFSSGSSGTQKAAIHDFFPLLEKFTKLRTPLTTLNFLLFDHWGGMNTMFHTLANGGQLISTNDRSPENICKLIEKYNVELLPTSPTFLNLLILSESYKKHDLSSLKIITYGTESMSSNTLKKINKIFPNIKIQQTYGLIEVGVLRSKSEKNNSLWVKLGGEEFNTRVVNGILEIKSKSTMLGYLNAPSPFTKDGWFITGDAVKVKKNYFKILGRESEIINVGGEKVFPNEVENVIQEINNVSEVLVYGEKHLILGNIVCAKIKLTEKQDKKQFVKNLKNYCKTKLEKYKIPIKISLVNENLHSYRYKKTRNI